MRRIMLWLCVPLICIVALASILFEIRHQQGNRKAAQIIADFQVIQIDKLGSTRTLRILPLIDYHSVSPDLRTEVGVSYLVETDNRRILFDVGQNARQESPSPLQSNMARLGIELASIDTVFISHKHFDHVGGKHWEQGNSFSLGVEQLPFVHPEIQVYVPDRMTYPGLTPVFADKPMRLGEGLATTGVIPRQLVIGWIEEQSLVVNVKGLGGVLIVGCGHQPVPNLIMRYQEAFSEPLYGVVGGLHFPVPDGRINVGPINGQRRMASGGGLFSPLTMDEIEQQIELLKQYQLGVIGVGGHDSSDQVIEMVRKEFGEAHRYIRIGEEIIIRAEE